MAVDSALPAYREKLLREGDARSANPAGNLFFHLGYWPDAAAAGLGIADLQAAQARLNDRLLDLAELSHGLRVLDVGCGIGGTLATAGDRFAAMRLVGLNVDRAQLQIASDRVRRRSENALHWVAADACALPFPDASFDRITAVECVFHFRSRREFFSEAARVMRPGGRLAVSDFVTSSALPAACPADAGEAIRVAVGPWPGFWGGDDDTVAAACAAGFTLAAEENASAATLPSYRCFLPAPPISDPRQATHPDPVDRAMALIEWLQRNRLIDMVFYAFAR